MLPLWPPQRHPRRGAADDGGDDAFKDHLGASTRVGAAVHASDDCEYLPVSVVLPVPIPLTLLIAPNVVDLQWGLNGGVHAQAITSLLPAQVSLRSLSPVRPTADHCVRHHLGHTPPPTAFPH